MHFTLHLPLSKKPLKGNVLSKEQLITGFKFMKKRFAQLLFATVLVLAISSSAFAGEKPKLISSHGDWKVYAFPKSKDKSCFMLTQPYKKEGQYKKRGEVFLFVTRWSDGDDKNVVSISNGYTFKKGSTVSVNIDGKKFKMYTNEGMAWTKDHKDDNAMTEDMRKGSKVVVKGVSKFGTKTKDTYSLKGSADAYSNMMKACE